MIDMDNKKFLLFITSIVLFGVAFVCLLVAMISHAIYDDSNAMPAIFAIISFALSLAAIISACLYGKGEKR